MNSVRIFISFLVLGFCPLFAGKDEKKKILPFLKPLVTKTGIKNIQVYNQINDKIAIIYENQDNNNKKNMFEFNYNKTFQKENNEMSCRINFTVNENNAYQNAYWTTGGFRFLITEKENNSKEVSIFNLNGSQQSNANWYNHTENDETITIKIIDEGSHFKNIFCISPNNNYFVYLSEQDVCEKNNNDESLCALIVLCKKKQTNYSINFNNKKIDYSSLKLKFSDDSTWLLIEIDGKSIIFDMKKIEEITRIDEIGLEFVPYNKYFLYNNKTMISLDKKKKYEITKISSPENEIILTIDSNLNYLCLTGKTLYFKMANGSKYFICDQGENVIKKPHFVGFSGKNIFVVWPEKNNNKILFYKKPKN